jgi:hypothetical protein
MRKYRDYWNYLPNVSSSVTFLLPCYCEDFSDRLPKPPLKERVENQANKRDVKRLLAVISHRVRSICQKQKTKKGTKTGRTETEKRLQENKIRASTGKTTA